MDKFFIKKNLMNIFRENTGKNEKVLEKCKFF